MGQLGTSFVARGIPCADCFRPGLLEFTRIEKNTYLFKPVKAIHEIEGERRNQSLPNYRIAIHGETVKLIK